MQDPNTMETLWARVDVRGPDECWPWTGDLTDSGYARISWGNQQRRVSRLILGLEVGDPRQGLHTCDNPPCCNPAHLYVGTHADNMRDRARRGRTANGARLPFTRLTDDDVRAIRRDPRPSRAVAADYGVHPTMVQGIRNGKFRGSVQ